MVREELKVRFEDIPPEGLDLSFEDRQGELVRDCFPVRQPIRAYVHLVRWGVSVKVTGRVETELSLTCDRCLEEFPFRVAEKIDVLLEPVATFSHVKEEIRLSREDLDVIFFDGETIEVDEVVREQILLAVPMRQLCREECKGLCPICGENLNQRSCNCKKEVKDSPFAILKKLVVSSR